MIDLEKCKLIGKGRDRAVYEHPDDLKLCIKVAIKPEKQSNRERRYLKFLLKKGRDLSAVSQYQGKIDTSMGTGYLFELVRDSEGNIAHTLKAAIDKNMISNTEVFRLIADIEDYLYSQNICAYDLSPNNIIITKNTKNKWQFTLIDGLGVAKPNPIMIRSPFFISKHLKTSFIRLRKKSRKAIDYRELELTPSPKKRNRRFSKARYFLIIFLIVFLLIIASIQS